MSAGAFGRRIVTGAYRDIRIVQLIYHHPNPGSGRINAAVSRIGVKSGAGYFTCTATNAFIKIYFYFFDYFLFWPIRHGNNSLHFSSILYPPKFL
jgi:hypothetical protein